MKKSNKILLIHTMIGIAAAVIGMLFIPIGRAAVSDTVWTIVGLAIVGWGIIRAFRLVMNDEDGYDTDNKEDW